MFDFKLVIADFTLDLVKQVVLTDENIAHARKQLRDGIRNLVDNPNTRWDDEAEEALIRLLGLDD